MIPVMPLIRGDTASKKKKREEFLPMQGARESTRVITFKLELAGLQRKIRQFQSDFSGARRKKDEALARYSELRS